MTRFLKIPILLAMALLIVCVTATTSSATAQEQDPPSGETPVWVDPLGGTVCDTTPPLAPKKATTSGLLVNTYPWVVSPGLSKVNRTDTYVSTSGFDDLGAPTAWSATSSTIFTPVKGFKFVEVWACTLTFASLLDESGMPIPDPATFVAVWSRIVLTKGAAVIVHLDGCCRGGPSTDPTSLVRSVSFQIRRS